MYTVHHHKRRFVLTALALVMMSACSTAPVSDPAVTARSHPLVTFVFDDGYETDYTVGREIFRSYGVPACTAVVTGWVNKKGYLSVDQLHELKKDGWEIMAHTVSHPNLRDLTELEIEAELSGAKAALEKWGLPVRNMVYPYNKSNETIRRIAARYYRAARAGQRKMNLPDQDNHDLKSYSSELSFRHKMKDTKARIDRAYAEKKWLILYQHMIDADIMISEKSGTYLRDETLTFSGSMAVGTFIGGRGSSMEFIPLYGSPRPGDSVSGETGGAMARVDKVYYNEREAIIEMIEYIKTNYSDMKIVTIDQGLDLLGMP